jgi:hypothetical protein
MRAKLAAPVQSLQRASRVDDAEPNTHSKARGNYEQQAVFDMNQEVFPVPVGAQMPAYITRDLQSIVIGSQEIDKLLSRAAAIVGAPRSLFNLDEKGTVHVETEKRKDRRYMKHIERAQRKMEALTEKILQRYWLWSGRGDLTDIQVKLSSPFEMTIEERVKVMREMNPSASFVSQRHAVKEIWGELTPDEREEMLTEIDNETPKSSLLSDPVEISL